GMEGGHSKRRVLHAGGSATGKFVVDFLISKIKENKKISVFENFYTYNLISDNNSCYGINALDLKSNECYSFLSSSTILATGGASGIYLRTTNPNVSTGDGIALAYEAGAEVVDMEFIQFHPTALYLEHGEAFLITEAIRGEGAYLLNHNNERFMPKYHKLAELAPRDVVAKAIFNEMNLVGKNNIFLKLDHLDSVYIKNRFINIYNELQKYGLDLTKDPIPVAPAAHYTIGGIKTGYHSESSIKGLLTAGEVSSTGIHGANRLASNSLPECMVFGKRAVDYAKEFYGVQCPDNCDSEDLVTNKSKEEEYKYYNHYLADLMTNKVGIVRSEKSISTALKEISKINKLFNFTKNEYYSNLLLKLLDICKLISISALERHESRGVHIREDFPEENPEFLFHIVQQKDKPIKYLPVEPNYDYVW
ncbi:MAG: FAD-binding protein, partial [Ignavibacteriales bacterium]|nr:FAD-binding protein [Ignavibacteriales bacterium]